MNEYVEIGRIVNTHGIKGELRLLSNFEKKEDVFKPGITLYIGDQKEPEVIKSYRHHKEFEMITLEGYDNINTVLKYKGKFAYVKKEILNLKEGEYLYSDLIGMEIKENEKTLGKIKDIMYNRANMLLYIEGKKNFYIPLNPVYVKKVDVQNKEVLVEKGSDLML